MATKITFSPPLAEAILDIGRAMVPEGYELQVGDVSAPDFLRTITDAEYFMGFARGGMGPEFYRAAPRLKLVQLLSAGYDRLDLEAARQARVPVANNGGANSVAVAEHAVTLMLAVNKKLVRLHTNVLGGQWRPRSFDDPRLHEVAGKTLGIVGLGAIGKKVARRAQAFDMRVQYYDAVRLSEDEEDTLGVRFVLFGELLRTSDVVSLHVPLNAATRKLVGAREFAAMKATAILVNTCRGEVVDEEALYHALTTGQIAGAGLDVLAQEPPRANHPLFALDNVIITPHAAGPTWESWAKRFRNAFDNIQRVAAGRPPLWVLPELR